MLCVDIVCNVFLFFHKTYKHIFIRQFLCIAIGYKTIKHVVMFYGRMATDSFETTVVVCEDQTIWRYNDTRAKARKVNYCIFK